MIFVAAAVLMLCFGKWWDIRRDNKFAERWIDEKFGKDISLADRLRIRRLYFRNTRNV